MAKDPLLRDAVRAIKAKIETAAEIATPEELAYLGTAIDRIGGRATVLEVEEMGVVAVHVDESVADAKAGLNYTFLHAGAHKVDGHPHAPLPASVTADIQADIEQLYDQFIALVAGFRQQLRVFHQFGF